MKHILATLFLISLAWNISAQKDKRDGDKHERMEALKIGFITNKLELTSEESQKFWPIYNEYKVHRKSLRDEYKVIADTEASSGNSDQLLTDIVTLENKKTELKRVYIEKFKTALPSEKIVKLHFIETEFKKDMIRKYRGHKGDRGGKRGGGFKD